MHTMVEVHTDAAATFGGISVFTLLLRKGEDLTNVINFDKLDKLSHCLILVGSGSLVVYGKMVGRDQIMAVKFTPPSIISAIEDTSLLVVKSKHLAEQEFNDIWIFDLSKPVYYNKYKAAISRIELSDKGGSLLAEWSSYIVDLPFMPKITLHFHANLRNILYFTGSASEIQGYVVVENNNRIHAWPVRGGDWAVIEKNVIHNVCTAKGHSMRFFVFNDETSDYETPETSDYHNLHSIDFEEILTMPGTLGKSPVFIRATMII